MNPTQPLPPEETPSVVHRLSTLGELEWRLQQSHDRPILVFNHSSTCPTSQRALHRLHRYLDDADAPRSYLIPIHTHHQLSKMVTRLLTVAHETPQAMLIAGGRAVWCRSPDHITVEDLRGTAARSTIPRRTARNLRSHADEGGMAPRSAAADGVPDQPRAPSIDDEPSPPDDHDEDEAPETPLDEPEPVPIQDPPADPDSRPYTVSR